MAPRPHFDLESLSTSIPAIFDQAQISAATHRKNCVALYKLQVASADVVESVTRGRDAEVKLVGERAFSEIFLGMLNRVLIVKKSTHAADRIVKFVAAYVEFLNEKASEADEEETSSSRFVGRLLRYFLKGFQAKSKEVRFRCLHFVSEVITSLGELDQDLYAELRAALLERLTDKEPLVRVHSVAALSLIAASEDPYDLDDDEPPIINSLLEALFYDTAAEVRRAALVQLPFSPTTLPALLTRMRDVDALTRKLVFTVVLPRLTNPRQLTIMQREQVVSRGLGDRTEAVRVATARLLGTWVDACEGDLGAFVALFDVQTPGIARDALKSVLVTRAEVANELEFDDMFWENLKPETALLACTFVEYCVDKKDESRLEANLPVMTALVFRLQALYNTYLELLQEEDSGNKRDKDANDAREEQAANAEFVIGELLRLAIHLDYTDEIGRRKMFGVVRNMLAHPELPEALTEPCVDVLRIMSPNERDLIRVAVEVINELRDTELGNEESMVIDDELHDAESTIDTARPGGFGSRSQSRRNVAEMTTEEKLEADFTDLRCLNLCIAVLGHTHGTFDENSTLRGVLEELIVPSVQRKELALREKGLVSLGLCCLISKNMALSSFQLFLSQVKSSPESLRIKVLQVVFDIMMTYEKDLFGGGESIGERVITFLMQVLEAEESMTVQSLMCLGLAKLMLFGLVTDERILMSLIFAYVSPTNTDNQELRQCLAYFLPVYCYSSSAHQMRLQSVFMKTLDLIFQTYEELENDQDMISPLQFGQLLMDWTDPSKIVGANEQQDFSSVHVHLAIDIVRALYDNERAVEERKTLCLLLGKLVFPKEVDEHLLYALYILLVNLTELCPFNDNSTEKVFLRFQSRFEKHFAHALAGYDEQVCFHDPMGTYNEVFEFLGVTRPKRRHFEGKTSADTTSKSGRARKDDDISAEEDDTVTEEEPSRPGRESRNARAKAEPKASRQRGALASSSEENEEQATDREQSSVGVAPRSGRTRGKEVVNPISAAVISSDDEPNGEPQPDAPSEATREDEEEEQSRPIPSTPPRKKGTKRLHTPTKSPTMASPMPKRQNRGRAAGRSQITRKDGASRASNGTATQPVKDVRNRQGKSKSTIRGSEPASTRGRGRGGRYPRPSYRAVDSSSDEGGVTSPLHTATEEEEDSDAPSDESITQQLDQRIRRPAPRVMEEKIGWDDGSDF